MTGWSMRCVPKDMRAYVREALTKGWRVRLDSRNHTLLLPPAELVGAKPISLSMTPSDRRYRINAVASFKRYGITGTNTAAEAEADVA